MFVLLMTVSFLQEFLHKTRQRSGGKKEEETKACEEQRTRAAKDKDFKAHRKRRNND
jgi:hypothetical protein